MEGLLRAKRDADDEGNAVTLLVLLSNSRAGAGQTNRSQIASDVWHLNSKGQVKIFSFGFEGSDIGLLRAIAIMNGGVADSFLKGTTDFQEELETFFDSEFGNVLLSDVNLEFSSTDAETYGETGLFYPVLSQGSEIVVRGLLNTESSGTLQVATKAMTVEGEETWTAFAEPVPLTPTLNIPNSLCFQSYAHARITQLIHFRDAAKLLGGGVLEPVVKLSEPCNETMTLVECIEEEALKLSLEANVVTAGLTGMVTVDENRCQDLSGEKEICMDGASDSGYWQDTTGGGSAGSEMGIGYFDDYGYHMSGSSQLSFYTALALISMIFWSSL